MKLEFLETFQLPYCLICIQLLFVRADHIAAVPEIPLQNELFRQFVPPNILWVIITGNHFRQNGLQTAIFYIIPYSPFVGALLHQRIALVIMQLHPLDFLVQRLWVVQVWFPMMTQSEKQIYRPLRRNGCQQIAEPYIQIGTFLHIAVFLFSMEHFEQNIHIRVKSLHFQQFGNTEITYSVNKDLNQHGNVNAAVK